GARSVASNQRLAMRPMRPASGGPVSPTHEPGSGRSGSKVGIEPASTTPAIPARGGTPRTPRRTSPIASESRIHRFEDADAFSSTALGGYTLSPDVALQRRHRIWTVVACACVVTVLGYGGVILWSVATRGAAGHTSTPPAALLFKLPVVEQEPAVGFVRALEGHAQPVTAVALSPDGRLALSASWDGTLRVWDRLSAKPFRTLGGHTDKVLAVAFSPDGRRALSGGADKTVRVWN